MPPSGFGNADGVAACLLLRCSDPGPTPVAGMRGAAAGPERRTSTAHTTPARAKWAEPDARRRLAFAVRCPRITHHSAVLLVQKHRHRNQNDKTTGNHTAAHAGARPAMPICREISANKKKPNPPTIPVMTIVWMPPERNDRNDTVAAKRTIAMQSSGRRQQQLVLDTQALATKVSPFQRLL